MRKIILTITFLFTAFAFAFSQEFNGMLTIKELPRSSTLNYTEAVQLFKAFKENKHPITFSLKAKNEQTILFDMVTTVRKNGKIISKTTRKNWPWLPGDMYVPVEAFDFIPIMQEQSKLKRNGKYELPDDIFDVMLEMIPSVKGVGKIEPLRFKVGK